MALLEVKNLGISFGGLRAVDGFHITIEKGQLYGLIGPNGAGKTTLMRIITGSEQPDDGKLTVGSTVELGYVDQSRDSLNDNNTVWQEISDGKDIITLGKREMPSRAYVGAFNFKGADQQKKVGQLSGGERNRVHMAKMLKKGMSVADICELTGLDAEEVIKYRKGK